MEDPLSIRPNFGSPISRRAVLTAVGVGGASILLPSCTSVSSNGQKSNGITAPRRGGTAVISTGVDILPATLRGQVLGNLPWQALVFNTLTEYDHKLKPKPALATEWELTEQDRVLRMTLRDDVFFHSGRPFGPTDVLKMIAYQVSKDGRPGQLRSTAQVIADAKATGPKEVTLRLAHSVSNLFDLFEIMYIFDHESLPDLEAGKSFNGTGPFSVREYVPGNSMSLARNEKYWRQGRPYLDAVNVRLITQAQAVLSSLRAGQTHVAFNIGGTDLRGLSRDPQYTITKTVTQDNAIYLGCNVKVAPLNDKRVRQAISYAIDRDRILSEAMGQIGRVTSVPWSPSSPAYQESIAGRYTLDMEKAKSLLADAGAVGAPLTLAFISGPAQFQATAEIVQAGLAAAGLKVRLQPLQQALQQKLLSSGTFEGLWINPHGFGQMHPATLLKGAYPFNADKNASNFSDPTYVSLADRVWKASSPEEEKTVYNEVTEFFLDQQFIIDLVSSSYTYTSGPKLHGYDYTMVDNLKLDDAFLS